MKHALLIAGVSSGTGKTTITMGLIAALHRRGLRVQPFKAGPDYIDPTYHSLAAGRPCRNIDTWMVPPDRALAMFQQATQQVDMAVIEGVMGLFDGFSYSDDAGSSAEIAKLVQVPVILVLDVGKMARSAGALALGYRRFDPELNLAGFILNRCGSTGHYEGVKQAVAQATGLPVVGYLPKDAGLHIPERHLGLVPTDERGELSDFISHAASLIETHLDLDLILEMSHYQRPAVAAHGPVSPPAPTAAPLVRLAVARDRAFSFYYEDNLDLLRQAGAEIVFFSPLADAAWPPASCGLYLGGGFPEIYAAELAANESMRQALRQAHAAGLPIYAECGGFMVLTEAIIDLAGNCHPMAGLVPGLTRMQPRLMSLGYRVVESPAGNFLLPAGVTTRGHEFHWSRWEVPASQQSSLAPAWTIQPRRGDQAPQPSGYAQGNLVASYVHLHFGHTLQLAPNFVRACRAWSASHAL
jgi:cobyrinic acid a,c-diamide synthase